MIDIPRINCIFYGNGKCGHPKAPPYLFFRPECVLIGDLRVNSCAIQVPHERPTPPPPPPRKP